MKRSYSLKQMRKADEDTIVSGTPSLTLMERAGQALAQAVLRALKEKGNQEVLFVCGGGNNGGDGFVAARILSDEGIDVSVLCLATSFSVDCLAVKGAFHGEVLCRIPRRRYPMVVDCVLGTGLTRAPEGDSKTLIEFINGQGAYVVSADLPSGLSENGVALFPCVRADETVCMGLMKNALLMEEGRDFAGRVTVAEIGIRSKEEGVEVWEEEGVRAYFPTRARHSNKGNYGNACIVAERVEGSGAPLLSAGACLKSGVGYTRILARKPLLDLYVGTYPACVLAEPSEDQICFATAVAYGMGAGKSVQTYERVKQLLSLCKGTLVLDADALNSIAEYGKDVLKERKCKVILTPHVKEFARLCGLDVSAVRADMVGLSKSFSREYGVTVFLKSNTSVIADGVRVALNEKGSPAMAKGGSGDVLSGFLVGTCARGVAPFEACCVSAYVCGRAGEIVSEQMGEYAPDATDLIAQIPAAMREVQA
ncbi:MAG: NAD(P)H-hydrate dehydratase [Clostridia bacterium]|nr:NAD(P)H-hydrate dehydratase [Clostridia bacterium]